MPLSWGRTVRQWEPSTARIPRGCASTEEAVSEAAKEVSPLPQTRPSSSPALP